MSTSGNNYHNYAKLLSLMNIKNTYNYFS